MKNFPFLRVAEADLVVEAVYEGGKAGTVADDPLGKLLPCGNQGGFRYSGSKKDGGLKLVVLYTSSADLTGPTPLIARRASSHTSATTACPASELHDTHRGGNLFFADALVGST